LCFFLKHWAGFVERWNGIGRRKTTNFQTIYLAPIRYAMGSTVVLNSQSVSALSLQSGPEQLKRVFWQQWEMYRDYLYRCCMKWMAGNVIDAEDAMSQAMLKAWEKMPKYAIKIANFKYWLTKLTHNLCVDIHRQRSREAKKVENIDAIADRDEQALVTFGETPENIMDAREKRILIRRAIANLPTRLRETFLLYFYEEMSYREIAQQQDKLNRQLGKCPTDISHNHCRAGSSSLLFTGFLARADGNPHRSVRTRLLWDERRGESKCLV